MPQFLRCFISLLVLLISAQFALSQIANTSVIKLKYGAQQSMRNVYAGTDGYSYVLMSKKGAVSTRWSKEKIILKKLDAELNLVKDIPLDFAKYDPDSNEEGIWLVHDSSFATHAIWNQYADNSVTFFTCPIEDVKSVRKIATIELDSKENVASVGVSLSLAQMAYSIDVVEVDEDLNRTHIAMLNEKLELLWLHTVECNQAVSQEGYSINDNGACLHMFKTVTKKDKKSVPETTIHFTAITSAGASSSTVHTFSEDHVSPTVVADNDILTGIIFTREMVSVKGKGKKDQKAVRKSYCFNFDPATGAMLSQTVDRLGASVISELIGKSSASLHMAGAYLLKDSSIIAIAVAKSTRPGRYVTNYDPPITSYQMAGTPYSGTHMTHGVGYSNTYKQPKAWFAGFIAFRITPDGEVGRIKSFETNYSVNDFWLMDLSPQQIGDNVYFTYMADPTKIHLVRLSEKDGKLRAAEQVFEKSETEGRALVPLTTSTTSDGSIIAVLNHPYKQARVVKFDIKS